MGVVIDTGVFVRFERTLRAIPFGSFGPQSESFVSAVTISEMMVGVYLANSPERRQRRQLIVDDLISKLPVLDFTTATARPHASIVATLRRTGLMTGAHDFIIAATALEHGHSLLTLNYSEFERVPGLHVIRWAG
jgi:tRNA(fMet)-specific endonuclease VapC